MPIVEARNMYAERNRSRAKSSNIAPAIMLKIQSGTRKKNGMAFIQTTRYVNLNGLVVEPGNPVCDK